MQRRFLKPFLVVFTSIFALSCSNQSIEPKEHQITNSKDVLLEQNRIFCFSSREHLSEILKTKDVSSLDTIHSDYPLLKTLSPEDHKITLEDLVPDVDLRELLSKSGEVIIADTLYMITEKGTFFCKTKYRDELLALTTQDLDLVMSAPVEENLYRVDNVYIYDTFRQHSNPQNLLSESDAASERLEEGQDPDNLRALSDRQLPDINSFELVRGSRQTWFGKLFQSLGIRKSHVKPLSGVKNRRLNCAVFDYNYYFRQSVGVTAKIQKKMWYGAWVLAPIWGQEDLRVGFESVIVRFPYPDNSTYGDIFERAFPDRDLNNINIQHGRPWLHTKPLRWPSSMNSKGLIEVDLGFFPMIEISTPSPAEIATAVSRHLYTIAKDLARRNNIYVDFESMDPFSPIPRNKRTSDLIEIIKELKVCVPVFAKDGIYVYFPFGEIRNTEKHPEITFRFAETYLTNFKLSFSGSTGDLSNINSLYKHIKVAVGNPDITLIQGNFYACAYSDKWHGYRLYWQR